MGLTRAQSQAALQHILKDVLAQQDTSPLVLSIKEEGITSIEDLINLSHPDIDSLVYTVPEGDEKGQTKDVPNAPKRLLMVFLDYVRYRVYKQEPITDSWDIITQEEFQNFRVSPDYLIAKPSNATVADFGLLAKARTTSTPSPVPATSTSKYSAEEIFKRGIKRDQTLFPTLKDERFHDSWHRSFENQAHAQGIAEVIDPNYTPSTQSEKDVFLLMQTFMYAVLENKVLTSKGKEIVRKHEATKDAQAAYTELLDHHRSSTAAGIHARDIMSYLTTVTIGDGRFRGSTTEFLSHWLQQVRLYQKLMGNQSTFGDAEKLVHLVRAVATVPELRQIKTTADMLAATTKTKLTFDTYYELLFSAAAQYDSSLKQRTKRVIYAHELDPQEDQDPWDNTWDDGETYDIDTPVSCIEANMAARPPPRKPFFGRSNRVSMPRERWQKLGRKAQTIWDSLPDQDKAIILGYTGQNPPAPSLQANQHEISDEAEEFHDAEELPPQDPPLQVNQNAQKPSTPKYPSTDIRSILSQKDPQRIKPATPRQANVHSITYKVSSHDTRCRKQSLVDRGANGGVAGEDVRVLFKSTRTVDIQGIDNHQMTNISIGTVAGVVTTSKKPVILIMHQYALVGRGHTIHSPAQWEWYGSDVNDKSNKVINGKQRILTGDNHLIPLIIDNGLARLCMRPPTDKEMETFPHVVVTADKDWDPSVLDSDPEEENEQWWDAEEEVDEHPYHTLFDEYGNYRKRVTVQHCEAFARSTSNDLDNLIDTCTLHTLDIKDNLHFFDAHMHQLAFEQETTPTISPAAEARSQSPKEPDYSKLKPVFGWLPTETIKKTFQHTTQLARITTGTLLKKFYKAQNPALNVIRRGEPVATDELYSDTPAVDCGATRCQVFVGMNTDVVDVYPMQTSKQFINTLEDNVRERGAPTKLVSDRAQVEISGRALEYLRILMIPTWQSEPHQQHQNYAERKIQHLKQMSHTIMDRTGAPAFTWLLCLMYVAYLLNHTWSENIKNVPITALLGITVDISVLLRFHFWQKVYFKAIEPGYPSDSKERLGHIVGISEHVGHALTWKVLDCETHKVIHRSLCRAAEPETVNLRIDPDGGEILPTSSSIIRSKTFDDGITLTPEEVEAGMPINPNAQDELTQTGEQSGEQTIPQEDVLITPEDLVGRTFLMDPEPDGQVFRARIVDLVDKHDHNLENNPERLKFLCKMDQDGREELLTYNQILDHLNRDSENPVVWKYKRIVSHQGPLKPNDKDYKGSIYNVMLEWEGGEVTAEPLNVIAKDDPVTCAIYAKENNLLNVEGWKRFKSIARRQKKFERMVKQAYLRSFRSAPKYKYGHEVPQNYKHAMRLDKLNGNNKWKEATDLELKQIDDYTTFKDLGHKSVAKVPRDHKRIAVHIVYDVKHDGRYKARLVADGHLTDAPLESVYSGVVSIRGFRIVMFLAELNGLEFWATDVGNAYLESYTAEKLYIIGGEEFGERQDHVLVIVKALYGLKSSGQRWHDRLHDCLVDLGFTPCKAEPDIWMRRHKDLWEYVAVYVDDLALAMRDPQSFIDKLTSAPYNFKLKGSGPITFHLGMDFERDPDGVLCLAPKKYIEKMIDNYVRLFGEKPNQNMMSPIEKGDHPEMDTSEFLDPEKVKIYQSLIGALQWVVTIGRFDVMTAVVTLSGFRAAPRQGHLDRVKRIYGYLSKMKHGKIRVRIQEPDYSDLPNFVFDWSRTVYGAIEEMLPHDAPEPLGKYVTLSHFVDANLMHDLVTGRSLTGILHLLNKTPVDWYSKKQATVEVATYGSELLSARTCVEQIIDLRTTLRYLGVPIRDKSYVFGDNESVVKSCTQVHAKLHKRHNMLSFHFVREAVAAGYVHFTHIPGSINPADILSKHWGYSDIWHILKPLLFWSGDTMDC